MKLKVHGPRSSTLEQPLLDSTVLVLPPNVIESSVSLARSQRRRTHARVRDAGLGPAPLNDFFNLIQRRVPGVEPFGRSSFPWSVARELGDGRHRRRRDMPARPRSRIALRCGATLVGAFGIAEVG